jgi:hypothetical protein
MSDSDKPDLHLLEAAPADKSGQSDGDEADAGPDDEARLSPKESRFVDALAAGETSCQAAKLAGISARTGRRWRQQFEIQSALRSRLNDSLGAARAILACGAARAATALVSMADGSEPAEAPRVAAARAVCDGAVKLCEVAELEARLAALEQQLTATNGGTNKWT